MILGDAPPSIVPKSKNFVDFDPVEVARQLTLIEHGLFRKIKPQEWCKIPLHNVICLV